MLLMLAVLGLATYGYGGLLAALCRLRYFNLIERIGIWCGLGAIVLGWTGYLGAVWHAPWLAAGAVWLGVAAGVGCIAWAALRRPPTTRLERTEQWLLWGALAIGLLLTAVTSYGQLQYGADGSIACRFLWPDLLYRNAIISAYLNCDGNPDWPWLADVPMSGMSVFRFTVITGVMKAIGLSSEYYHVAALWLGLFGVPVTVCAAFALFRAMGADTKASALAVLLTSFVGNPRWLLNERFAHSPALHWSGTDVFAVSIPVFFVLMALIFMAARERHIGLWIAAGFILASATGHAPWMALPVYTGVLLWAGAAIVTRRATGAAWLCALGALLGIAVLRYVCGTGTTEGGGLTEIFGPTRVIRNLQWAIPFLGEPLRPLLEQLSPVNLLKLFKFIAVYPVAAALYVLGSLWVRAVIICSIGEVNRERLREPHYCLVACISVTAILLSTVVDFDKAAFQGAWYDTLRFMWAPLLFANLGVALLALRNREYLRRGWRLVGVLLFLFYGSWETVQIAQWSRIGLTRDVIPAAQVQALHYLSEHAQPRDIVLINPMSRTEIPGASVVGHNWGYASGLLNARFWLDNQDMAFKFGQEEIWMGRLQQLKAVLHDADGAALQRFLQDNDIHWVILEGADEFGADPSEAGLQQVFAAGDVRVYENRAP